MTSPARRTARYYDRLSHIYDFLTSGSEGQMTRRALNQLAIRDGEKILEIGFGTGKAISHLIMQSGGAGNVVGIDLSMGMCQRTKTTLLRNSGLQCPALIQGDGCYVPLKSTVFDAIFLSFTLELLSAENIVNCLNECKRLLVSDGRLGLVCLLAEQTASIAEQIYTRLHEKIPHLLDCRPIPITTILVNAGYAVNTMEKFSLGGIPIACVVAHAANS
jgi:ubiquinone/menaquinone biosynthesis C-methylase UbiE